MPGRHPMRSVSLFPFCAPETHFSGKTRIRGSGIIVDSSGLLLTAAHVMLQLNDSCALTVIVPSSEWSRTSGYHPFSIKQCETNLAIDVALCSIVPIESERDWMYLRAASLRRYAPAPNTEVRIMGFTGWGFYPTVLRARIQSVRLLRRQDGCYCDFAVDTTTYQGMSGSALVTSDGQVVGLITTSGTGKFRGLSFGTDFERAAGFLKKNGVGSAEAADR
jgi:hypothetical protein